MPLTIPDEVLEQAKLTEPEARVEIACRLYDAGKLDMSAAQFAGLSRVDFEAELVRRELPVFRPTWEEIEVRPASGWRAQQTQSPLTR